MTAKQLARYFDHTLLKAYATEEDFRAFCADCAAYGFAMAAINPAPVKLCKQLLRDTPVHVGAAVGFPLGQNTIETKLFETRDAIANGADEIDYVVNLTQLKAGNLDYVAREMDAIVSACREKGVLSKVIFENCYLTQEEKLALCAVAREVRPDFVKTSTGFGTGGATLEDVRLMLDHVGPDIRVKAAGGVRDLDTALTLIDMGVGRIGSTASIKIVEAFKAKFGE
ncbi:MAG: deoxyribose-phosphate aldolase [Candidatus Spyradocola sp.]|nr:deoxyribose-phosphate aldolase [Candidatus Spyradocola sp.]